MALAGKLGEGGRYHGNCRRLRLTTGWTSYNPDNWFVAGVDIFSIKWSGLYKLHNIEDRLWLADTNGVATHIPSPPQTDFSLNSSHGVFYYGPKANIRRYLPPELEFNKKGEPYPVLNSYFTPYLGNSQKIPSFLIGGEVIATTDFNYFWGSKHNMSFVSDGKYNCDWVLVEGNEEEIKRPKVRGNPTPDPEPREANGGPAPPDERKESESAKNIDLTTIFIYYQSQQYQDSYVDYGVQSSFMFSGLRPFTFNSLDFPLLLTSHGVTFFVDKIRENKHKICQLSLDKNVAKSTLVFQASVNILSFFGEILWEDYETKKEIFNNVTNKEVPGVGVPKNARIWSYSYYPLN